METEKSGEANGVSEEPPVNHGYLIYFAVVLCMGSTCQAGWAVAENGQVGFILAEKFGWEKEGLLSNITIVTILGPMGLATGSFLGGKVIARAGGIRRLIILTNLLAIITSLLKITLDPVSIMLGRYLYGTCCGIMNFCLSKALNDTVPFKVSQYYSVLINSGICFGIFFSNFLGLLVPIEDQDDPNSL
mmetsp:Transcript_11875/g.20088  ORF Transcript_11875/g.20088 Transcript_11875/m.20088 type:complete len:189 (+) Transcript_11875:191-757(+)